MEHFKVITFYQFINLKGLEKLSKKIEEFCRSNKIRGSVIIAGEGLNGTLAGLTNNITEFEKFVVELGFSDLNSV